MCIQGLSRCLSTSAATDAVREADNLTVISMLVGRNTTGEYSPSGAPAPVNHMGSHHNPKPVSIFFSQGLRGKEKVCRTYTEVVGIQKTLQLSSSWLGHLLNMLAAPARPVVLDLVGCTLQSRWEL